MQGYETPQEYLEKGGTIGAICGRFANRIRAGKLTVGGKGGYYGLCLETQAIPDNVNQPAYEEYGSSICGGALLQRNSLRNGLRVLFLARQG